MSINLTLAELVTRFDGGDIRLPLMQRDYVWRGKKVIQLLDSIYRGWPIGSFYLWRTHEGHATKTPLFALKASKRTSAFYGFLLDGQQRLTSLSLALQGPADGALESRAFLDLSNETFVLGTSNKRTIKRIERADPLLVPLFESVAVDASQSADLKESFALRVKAIAEQELLSVEERGRVPQRLERLSTMLLRPALCEFFDDNDEEHAFELFARLNKGGTSLQAGEVQAAKLASQATRAIVGPMRQFAAEPEARELGINFIFLLRVLISVHRGSCRFSDLPKSWTNDAASITESWKSTSTALRTIIQFVREEVGWRSRRWLPSTNALIPLVYVLSQTDTGKLAGVEIDIARKYLLFTGLRSYFQGSPETAINGLINAVKGSRAARASQLKALLARVPKSRRVRLTLDEVLTARGPYSPLMQVYYAWMYARGVTSFPSGEQPLARNGSPEVGHTLSHPVFQRFLSEDIGAPGDSLAKSVNYVLLTAADAKRLSGESPIESWRRMRASERASASGQLLFEVSENLLHPQSFSDFLTYRGKKLQAVLNGFLDLE